MSTVISGSKLKEAVEKGTFIVGGDVSSVEAVKYDFHMGSRVLKAEFGQPMELADIPQDKRWVLPGEAVFVLSREKLHLPRNMIAALVPKRKLAHLGIMVLGGLSVDPEYKGFLLVGLYNFSSTAFPLRPDKKLIAAMFYELSEGELVEFSVAPPDEIRDFPDDLVNLIKNYRPIAIGALQEELEKTRTDLAALKADLTSDKQWKRDFQEALERQSREIDKLLEGLKEEKEARKTEDTVIRGRLDSMSDVFAGFRNVWVLMALLVAAILGYVVPKVVDEMTTPHTQQTQVQPAPAPPSATAPVVPRKP